MNNRVVTFINTEVSGRVIQIEHNLEDTVYPFLFEPNESGHLKALSLYSPVVAEVKLLDKNIFQISFTSDWVGYIHLIKLNVSGSQYLSRLESLESKAIELHNHLEKLVNGAQWRQMNTYMLSEIEKVKKDLQELVIAQELLRKQMLEP